MAKKSKTQAAETVAPVAAKPAARKRSTSMEIVLKRDMKVGDEQRQKGDRIAEIQLEPGVPLDFLVDAVHGGLAGEMLAVEGEV